MKALSLWQPWASLWACGRKRFETRGWYTAYRGPLAVHAAKRPIEDPGGDVEEILIDQFGADWHETLPRGALLASGHLIACHGTTGEPFPGEYAMGDWRPGRYAWELADATALSSPIPWRGRQGLFEVPDAALRGAA